MKTKKAVARPTADQGYVAALDALIAALGRKPPIDQQEVQRAAQELVALPDDVFDWGTNTRLAAITTELRTTYCWGPPESIPARPSPSLLRGLKELREEIGGPMAGSAVATELLSERELEVDQLIRDEGPLQGKEIADKTGLSAKVLSNHLLPALKTKRGLQNKRSRGYFYPNSPPSPHVG